MGNTGTMTAKRRTLKPADHTLTGAVDATVAALRLDDEDNAVVRLAYTLAETIDDMDDETRAKMLGQTAGQLLNVLRELDTRSRRRGLPRPNSRLQQFRDQHARTYG